MQKKKYLTFIQHLMASSIFVSVVRSGWQQARFVGGTELRCRISPFLNWWQRDRVGHAGVPLGIKVIEVSYLILLCCFLLI